MSSQRSESAYFESVRRRTNTGAGLPLRLRARWPPIHRAPPQAHLDEHPTIDTVIGFSAEAGSQGHSVDRRLEVLDHGRQLVLAHRQHTGQRGSVRVRCLLKRVATAHTPAWSRKVLEGGLCAYFPGVSAGSVMDGGCAGNHRAATSPSTSTERQTSTGPKSCQPPSMSALFRRPLSPQASLASIPWVQFRLR
jgi:hypothetical protein